jgi:hypothetical protein
MEAPTGSATTANTIGTVLVACRKGATAALVKAMTTSGPSAINSVGIWKIRRGYRPGEDANYAFFHRVEVGDSSVIWF